MSDAQQVVAAFIAAIEDKDIERAVGMVADTASYENMPIQPIVGKQAIRAALEGFLATASRVDWRVLNEVVVGKVVINERLDRFQIGDGWLELPVAGFFEIDDHGLISVWRDYFDMATYTRQLAALTNSS